MYVLGRPRSSKKGHKVEQDKKCTYKVTFRFTRILVTLTFLWW